MYSIERDDETQQLYRFDNLISTNLSQQLPSSINQSTPSNSSSKKLNQFDDEDETFINLDLQSLSTDFKNSDHGRFDRDDSRFVTTTDDQSQFKSSDSTFGMGLNHFVRVFIPSHTTEVDIEGKYTSFNILVQTAFATVEVSSSLSRYIPTRSDMFDQVKRRYKNFLSLHQELSQKISRDRLPQLPKKKRLGVLDPSFVDERKQSLELYLQSLISIREVWNCACFTEFLDLSHPFLGIHLQMSRMTEEVGRLGDENKFLLQQLQYTRSALSNSNKIVTDLLHRVETLEDVIRESLPCPCHSTSSPITPHLQKVEPESLPLVLDTHVEEVKPSLDEKNDWWGSSPPQVENYPQLASGIFQQAVDSRLPSFLICPDTARVLEAFIPLQEFFQSSTLGRLTNTVLTFMTPTVEQLKLRFQVEKYIAKLVRKSLGAQVYQMGLYSIRSFLPDDPVTLSIYLCRGLENSWYLRLNEKLCRMSSSIHAQREATDSADDPSLASPEAEPIHPPPAHIIKNVSFMEENCEHRLQCVIGNYTVDIRATQKIDLCFAAFIEEIDRAVGRDHLFKKSLILIRSWWTVEAPTYPESGIPSIPTSAICVMVCAIFSRFHQQIYHPINALIIFLTEYASFDWSTQGITVYGPILLSSLESETLSHERCFELFPESLITKNIIGKYEEFLQPVSSNSDTERQLSGDKVLLNELFFSLEGGLTSSGSQSIAPKEKYPGYIPSDSLKIFHPLSVEVNIIPASDSEQYPSLLTEIFVKGRNAILPILALAAEVETSSAELLKFSELENQFQSFFRETYSKYSHNYQADMQKTMSFESLLSFELDSSVHDVQKPSTLLFSSPSNESTLDDSLTNEIIRDPLIAPIETLYEQIRYCNFLLGAEVSESTLQALSKDILNERGPLPVGEIGKMLQEITGISTLSAYLKDKFGGLKKFLENFPDDFVICTDHPFNPHVFLRNVLNHEEYKLITSGILPPHLMSRGNKRRTTRKKRLSNNSLQSLYSDHNSPITSPGTSISSNGRGIRTSFRPEGLRSVMSSPYLTALMHNSPNHYQGESWDLAANQPHHQRLHHTMSSSALERLGDHNNYQTYPPSYTSTSAATGYPQENYGQYTEISYRTNSGNGNIDHETLDSYNSRASYSRRRKTLPPSIPSYQGAVQYCTPSSTSSTPNHLHHHASPMISSASTSGSGTASDGYGHMGIPDPRAPAFIPGTGYM